MKTLKKLAVLPLCSLCISKGNSAEAISRWFEQSLKSLSVQSNTHSPTDTTQKPLLEEHYSVQSLEESRSLSPYEYSPIQHSLEKSALPNVYATLPQLVPIYRPLSTNNTNTASSPQPKKKKSRAKTMTQTTNTLMTEALLLTKIVAATIPRPIIKTHFINEEEVALMKNDKSRTDELLDLIYWNHVPICYTLDQITANKNNLILLKRSPDHRLWSILYNLDGFLQFPGLVDTIIKYADGGLATAQYILGHMCKTGYGVPKDPQKAMNYWFASAYQGLSKSQNQLGLEYAYGKLIDKNNAEAMKFMSLAAEQGDSTATGHLGEFYFKGIGVEKNNELALKYLLKANLDKYKGCITTLLTPVVPTASNASFSEEQLLDDLREKLNGVALLYSPMVSFNGDYSLLSLQDQQMKMKEYRSWVYDFLMTEAIPLLEDLKTVSHGFLINCLQPTKGVVIGIENNSVSGFYERVNLQRNGDQYLTFGENNVVIKRKFQKVINFFLKGIEKKLKKIIGDVTLRYVIQEEEKSLLKLKNRLVAANHLFVEASEQDKSAYFQELSHIKSKVNILTTGISALQKAQKDQLTAQEELPHFKKIAELFSDYVEKGAHGRNEAFLKQYPYLRG